MIDPDLKEFIQLSLGNVIKEMNRLSVLVENQTSQIRNIEVQMTTRIAELQKDVDNAFEEIEALKRYNTDKQYSIEKEEGARQAADLTIIGKFDKMNEEHKNRWEKQSEINQSIRTLSKVLWAVFTIVLGLVITLIWNIILNGGIQ